MGHMIISRTCSRPGERTFDEAPIRDFVARHAHGIVCDPFAGDGNIAKSLTDAKYLGNDIDEGRPVGFHADAIDFLRAFPDESVDAVLLDPPRTQAQVAAGYRAAGVEPGPEATRYSFWSALKDEAMRIIKPGGIALSFGSNSNGLGARRGFSPMELLVVAHGGSHEDTMCLAERKEGSLWK